MKCKFFLTLLILIISGFILFYGCSGSDGIVEPSSISDNQGNTNQTVGFITIRVVWPENGIEGECIISSGNEQNTLTASMPGGTTEIKIKVREQGELNPDEILLHGEGKITWPAEDTITIGPIPSIWVTIRAEAYDKSGNQLSAVEEDLEVKPGPNTVGLNLGDYRLSLTAEPVMSGLTSSGSFPTEIPTPSGPTPTPTITSDTYNIKANLSLVYPATGTGPTPTPTPEAIANKPIHFKIIEGEDLASFDDGSPTGVKEVTVNSLSDGNCSTVLKLEEEGTVVVEATYVVDNGMGTFTYSDTCVVNGEFDYSLTTEVSPEQLPSFPDLKKEAEVKAILTKNLPDSIAKPVSGKEVKYEIESITNEDGSLYSGSDIFLSYPSDITDSQGEAKIYLICSRALGNGRKKVKITMKVDAGTPDNPDVKETFRVVNIGDYNLQLDANPVSINTPYGESTIRASLMMSYLDSSPIPIEGKTIEFKVNSSSITIPGELTLSSGPTSIDGFCETTLKSVTNRVGTIEVEAVYKEGSAIYNEIDAVNVGPKDFFGESRVINYPENRRYFYPGETIEFETRFWGEKPSGFSMEGLLVRYTLEDGPPGTEILGDLETTLNAEGKVIIKIKIGTGTEPRIMYATTLYRPYDNENLYGITWLYGYIYNP